MSASAIWSGTRECTFRYSASNPGRIVVRYPVMCCMSRLQSTIARARVVEFYGERVVAVADTIISRELLSDQVYDMILASILDGSREPGSRIVESEIARQLGISQAPVREAVKKLVHAGLVDSVPRRGSYVTEISQDEFAIAREMRAALESVGARVVAEKLSKTDATHLRAIVAKMSAALDNDDWAAFRTLDLEFHRSVIRLGKLAVLGRMWDTLEPLLVSQRAIGDPSYHGDRAVVVGWHADLVDVLVSGDKDAASAAFFAHASGALGNDR